MESKKEIVMNHVSNIEIDITKPMPIKEMNLTMNKLALFVGANGTGKSFIMKLVWMFATQMNNIAASRKFKMSYIIEAGMQDIVDMSLRENDLTGTININYIGGEFLKVEFDEGKVISHDYFMREEIVPQSPPIFMSSDTRLISALTKYLAFKDAIGVTSIADDANVKKLNKMYPLYDIIFLERQIALLDNMTPERIKKINETIKEFDDKFEEITDLKIDYTKSDVMFTTAKHTYKSLTSLGAGHQSLFTMFIAQ